MRQHTPVVPGPVLTWTAYNTTTQVATFLANQDLFEDPAGPSAAPDEFNFYSTFMGGRVAGEAVTFQSPRTIRVTTAASVSGTAGEIAISLGQLTKYRSVTTGQPVQPDLAVPHADDVVISG